MSKQPPPAPTASTIGPCPTVIHVSRTPRHWKFTQHLRTTQPPQAPVNIFRNQAQNGSKGHYFFLFFFGCCCCFYHTALQSYKGIFEFCRLTQPYRILISKYVLQVNAHKNNGKRQAAGCQVFYRKIYGFFQRAV